MGADGNVDLYDYDKVDAAHREAHGRGIEEDWPYLKRACSVKIGGKRWIVAYSDTSGNHDSTDEFWCESEEAAERVRTTLYGVGCEAYCEVWT